jgi:hypothetical protein
VIGYKGNMLWVPPGTDPVVPRQYSSDGIIVSKEIVSKEIVPIKKCKFLKHV